MILFVRATLVPLIFLCCAFSFNTQTLFAQPQVSAKAQSADQALRVGIELEQQREWIKAIQHYEVALRTHVDHVDLKRRLLISRLHYDVVRRINDTAILDLIGRVEEADVLELYTEVLARLETSYVEPVQMADIVRNGTAYLEVALTEPGFLKQYVPPQSPEAIERFRTTIQKLTLGQRASTRFDARNIVHSAAEAAHRSIGIEPSAVVMQFVFGAVGLLDPYSSFLSSAELNEVESQIEGNFVGLGIALEPHEVPLRILNVIPGGPALEAGLQAGDLILQIDSTVCSDIGAERAADLLRGPEQSHVRLLCRREIGNEFSEFERVVSRRRVEVPSIEDTKLLDPAAGVAYLKISSFQKTTAGELDEALWSLHRQGMQSLIVDLRGNPGGWLDASVAVADRFLTEGGIVSTRGKNGIENQNYSATRSGTWQVPVVVLIDGDSASASEILAGAIRDNRRGTLVGQTTYGKGSVQGLFHTKALSSGIRLTVSKFYSPSGRAISLQGVPPTVPVLEGVEDSVHFVAKVDPEFVPKSSNSTDRALQVAIEQARRQRLTAQVSRN